MSIYFGTDGIRGKYNDDLTVELAYKIGNALASTTSNIKIIIGKDTRSSGDILSLSFACGAMNGGSSVTDVGICPTAGISYLTSNYDFDYGVIITASHNPAEYNGIKIFDKSGQKISDKQEELLEKRLIKHSYSDYSTVGKYYYKPELIEHYINYIDNLFSIDLCNKKIVIDCSNGASYYVATKIFENKKANLVKINTSPNGININDNCGALHLEQLKADVITQHADFGFAYDGDSDRVIAISNTGKIISGDILIYIISTYFKDSNKLTNPIIVGTKHTNMGIENELSKKGIKLIRTNIGDKYVSEELIRNNLNIGGEQSGHIIVRDYLPTGDGILNSLLLTYICSKMNKKLSDYENLDLYKQENINITVKNKYKIINDISLKNLLAKKESELKNIGRIMLRMSGTEPCIRIMVESQDCSLSKKIANEFAELILNLNKKYD